MNEFQDAIKSIINGLPGAIQKSLDELATIAVSNAKSSTLFRNRSGNLRNKINFTRDGEFSRIVLADTPYACFVEFGNNQNGPIIRPKNKKALRFTIDGQVLFRKFVRAHGPLPFMDNARKQVESMADMIVSSNIQSLIENSK